MRNYNENLVFYLVLLWELWASGIFAMIEYGVAEMGEKSFLSC